MKDNRKRGLVGVLAVLLALVCVGGTIAWMTAEDSLKNTFTVGSFNEPTKPSEPDDPDTDGDEDKGEDEDGEKPDGFLFETEWDEDDTPQLTPGKATAKNPNIGLGKGSQDAYIFIFVKNNAVDAAGEVTLAKNAPFFSIEKQWAAVTDNNTTEGDYANQVVTPTKSEGEGAPSGAYVDGLFMYVADSSTSAISPVLFDIDANLTYESATQDNAYTGELFETITIPNGNGEGIKDVDANVSVYAYIYGADAEALDGEEGSASAALDAAVQWAEGIKADSSK